MKVSELIEKLKHLDPETTIVNMDPDSGICEVMDIVVGWVVTVPTSLPLKQVSFTDRKDVAEKLSGDKAVII